MGEVIFIIVFGLFLCLIWTAVAYAIIYVLTTWIRIFKRTKLASVLTGILLGLLHLFYLSISPVKNEETATIQKYGDIYLITMTGTRVPMVHDPISILTRPTIVENFQLWIPRAEGVILGNEFPTKPGYYKTLGTLTIDKDKMKVDLYCDNDTEKAKVPLDWNGEYKLTWKKEEPPIPSVE